MGQSQGKRLRPLVVVLGQYRGGTSAITGIVKKLGGWGGDGDVRPPNISNPTGFHENPSLDSVCKSFFELPEHKPLGETSQKVEKLKGWRKEQENSSPEGSKFLVAKNPLLCLMTNEMELAWPDAKYIGVRRDPDHSRRSVIDRGWDWSEEQITSSILSMARERDTFLESKTCLWVNFETLISDSEQVTRTIAEFIDPGIGDSRIKEASRTINPKLRRANLEKGALGKTLDWIYAYAISLIGKLRYKGQSQIKR